MKQTTAKQVAPRLKRIQHEVDLLYSQLLIKKPAHFSYHDVFNALFAASLFSVLIFSQLLIDLALSLSTLQVVAIILITSIFLTLEIYYLSYAHVGEKSRAFGQFWAKRFFTLYGMTLFVAILLIYLYNINMRVEGFYDIIRIAVATAFPASIAAGATALSGRF